MLASAFLIACAAVSGLLLPADYVPLSFVFIVVMFALGLWTLWVVRCPQCTVPFGNDLMGVAFPGLAPRPVNFCQRCGASVDIAA
jgi:hypothetical protein